MSNDTQKPPLRWNPVVIAAAIFFVLAAGAAMIYVPAWLLDTDQSAQYLKRAARATALASTRQAVLFGLGGIIAVVGVVLSLHRHAIDKFAAHQTELDFEERQARAAEDYALREDENRTSRYTAAIAQLADTAEDVQLGGVYALSRLARDSKSDAVVVFQVLTASLRRRNVDRASRAKTSAFSAEPHNEIERAIFEILLAAEIKNLPLVGVSFRNQDLHGAYLFEADCSFADFSGANLQNVNLEGARMSRTNWFDADATGGNFDRTIVYGADPSQAKSLRNASFQRADLFQSTWLTPPDGYANEELPDFFDAFWIDEPGKPEGLSEWTNTYYRMQGNTAHITPPPLQQEAPSVEL